jgi:hypothetical protein
MAGQKRVFALDVPAIHVLSIRFKQDVDARHEAGHDRFLGDSRSKGGLALARQTR